MIIFKQKIFGGNRENRAKKKKWEAKEGLKEYKELTDPGTDMAANPYVSSKEVQNNIKELKENPGKARQIYRDMKDWNIDKKRKIGNEIYSDAKRWESSVLGGSGYRIDHRVKVEESIPKITNKYLNESHTERMRKHDPSRVVEEVKKTVTKPTIPAGKKSKSVLSSISSWFKKVRV